MTDYRTAAVSAVLTKEMRALLIVPSHDNATRCVELMDRLREHDSFAFECLRQDDDPKIKAVATFVAGIPRRADRQLPASPPRSVEPEPPPVRTPVQRDRSTPWTYADRAEFEATQDRGGRFAAVNEFVRPGEIPQYPRQPAGSPWASDLVGNEPALGYEINALAGQEPKISEPTRDELIKEITRLREALEQARSGDAAPTTTRHVERSLDEGDGPPVPSPSFSNQKEE
jgi:hypothetical protein